MNIKRERSETAQAGFGALLFKIQWSFRYMGKRSHWWNPLQLYCLFYKYIFDQKRHIVMVRFKTG